MTLRRCKIVIVLSVALLFAAIAFNNICNYGLNFSYVRHVLEMSKLPAGSGLSPTALHIRAVQSPLIHHFAYWLIIITECAIAILCLVGAVQLWNKSRSLSADFNQAKCIAFIGLTLGFVLLVAGFFTIGGEWFYLWLAPQPFSDALNAATRLVLIDSSALVFLALPD